MAQGSLCVAQSIRAYFNTGELPSTDTVCDDVTVSIFSGNTGWDVVVEGLTNNTTST
jgi:hypothetical protein